jgi:hypothetical protein
MEAKTLATTEGFVGIIDRMRAAIDSHDAIPSGLASHDEATKVLCDGLMETFGSEVFNHRDFGINNERYDVFVAMLAGTIASIEEKVAIAMVDAFARITPSKNSFDVYDSIVFRAALKIEEDSCVISAGTMPEPDAWSPAIARLGMRNVADGISFYAGNCIYRICCCNHARAHDVLARFLANSFDCFVSAQIDINWQVLLNVAACNRACPLEMARAFVLGIPQYARESILMAPTIDALMCWCGYRTTCSPDGISGVHGVSRRTSGACAIIDPRTGIDIFTMLNDLVFHQSAVINDVILELMMLST